MLLFLEHGFETVDVGLRTVREEDAARAPFVEEFDRIAIGKAEETDKEDGLATD